MPIFGETSSPYDESVEKVTAETCTTENWTLILDICDRVVADQNKGFYSILREFLIYTILIELMRTKSHKYLILIAVCTQTF